MAKREADIEALLPFCSTERQREILTAFRDSTAAAVAKQLGITERRVFEAVTRVKRAAAIRGHAPEHDLSHVAAPGFEVKGTSTLYGDDGKPKLQWVKTRADDEARLALMREAADALSEELPRLAKATSAKHFADDLASLYTLTDAHVGALCWHREGGADWDLKIAERTLGGCFEMMLESSPASKVGIVAQLGDFLHQDSMNAVTPTSGHLLDADGRFSKVVRVAVQTLRRVVDGALRKHKHVLVLMAEGNHDMSSSIWLRTMFKALYENEPRVEVIDSPLPYYAYRHGKTMLGWHHGHLRKNDQLPLLFAAQFPTIWGDTVKRYVHTGHRHHVEEREHSGMTIVQHPTLAARDAYAARGGWIAERKASAIVYHLDHGEVGRVTVTPEMLQ